MPANAAALKPLVRTHPLRHDTLTLYICTCRVSWYGAGLTKIRPPPGHAGHAHPEGRRARPDSRLRDRAAAAADVRRRTAGPTGFALSRTAPAREASMVARGVGGIRHRPRGTVLHAHQPRPSSARRAARVLGSAVSGNHRRASGRGLTMGWKADPRVRDEVRFHRDRLIEDYIASGMDRREAERRAFLEFGNAATIEESVRDVRGRWLDDLSKDLTYSFRTLRRAPAFTVVAVLSLALGIGANAAIFSLINAVMLRSLPVERPDRLVRI